MKEKKISRGLTGSQLKGIALLAMTADHIGVMLLPQYPVLRIIGRLAFPIFGYMIAEGCRHTRNRFRYLGTLAAVAAVCQVVYFVAMGSLYQCVFVAFSLSVGLICLLMRVQREKSFINWFVVLAGVLAVLFLTEVLPRLLVGTDYGIEYGFFGVMLPVCVYLAKGKNGRLAMTAMCLFLLSMSIGWIQWFSLLALPLLALYNGERGQWNMKYFFYLYYPLHLVVIYGIALLLGNLV